jgi:hypothetical protein
MGEKEKPSLILGRPFLKTVGATIDVGKGEIMFDINGEKSSFKFRPRIEACNMIEVKKEPKQKDRPKKKKEPKKMDVKKIKKGVASVKTKEEKPPRKTSPRPRWCGSGYPRLQRPQRALIRSNQVKKSSHRL